MDFGGPDALFALANMLNPPQRQEDIDDDDDDDIKKPRNLGKFNTPGDISTSSGGNKPLTKDEKRDMKRQERTKNTNSKDIWDVDEVLPSSEYDDVYDTRTQPEYTITYRQTVTTDDVYLGMSYKTPSTASCELMVVRITLPDSASANDIELNVKKAFLDCRTRTFKLGLHLPHPVDDKSAKAEWNSAKHELSVSLRMVRDFDEFNF